MARWRAACSSLSLLQGQAGAICRTTCSAAAATLPFQKPALHSCPGILALLQSTNLALSSSGSMRSFSTGLPTLVAKQNSSAKKPSESGLVQESTAGDITDQIPHIVRPMGVVEGTSYGALILGGLAFAAAVIWAVVNELLIQPLEYTCFNLTLKKLQDDPRVTVRLGTPVSGYGQDSRSRQQRQRIPHRVYKDVNGTEKVQVQFFAKGPSGNARISAEMYQDASKEWKYSFLYMDVENPVPQRVLLIDPQSYR